ncbi:hypothetical protein [Nostoc sp.]|uniref:hypothetical protein n=1 Tax=Nostoc sp. TaxID=1180 RepID=UPI002FF5010E
MSDPEFARWFMTLKSDIEIMPNKSKTDEQRIIAIHSKLIDLIDFLDPNYVRIALKYRTRIE